MEISSTQRTTSVTDAAATDVPMRTGEAGPDANTPARTGAAGPDAVASTTERLTRTEFTILRELVSTEHATEDRTPDEGPTGHIPETRRPARTSALPHALSQRELARRTGASLGTVNAALRQLRAHGHVDEETGRITATGLEALAPYRVTNAVLMAAGMSTRFVPLSYERPKGLLTVRGEVLVERQIRQLKAAGITDITVVVGYMKEQFFYLEDKFGVRIAVNPDYATRNNNSTLMLVRDQLANTYVCSSDDYFAENPFEPYVYEAYYALTHYSGHTDEYWVDEARDGRITSVNRTGGTGVWGMLGHVYFDRAFSERFRAILEQEYDRPDTADKLWEDIYADHVHELRMVGRHYPAGAVFEFDSLRDLTGFDHDFLDNVDSKILDNICHVLGCRRGDISDIAPIKEGLTNLSFRFSVGGATYVYRHPGPGTGKIINRRSETYSQLVAKRLGIDDTFIHEDLDEGWKISRYVDGCVPFDYHDPSHVAHAMGLARRLHGCGKASEWSFDLFEKAEGIAALLGELAYPLPGDFDAMRSDARMLARLAAQDGVRPCLCHNDFYNPNFLVSGTEMYLIDWEYSAMSDYASDLGTFICCSDYTVGEADQVLATYFGRVPKASERRHCMAYVGLAAYYWYVWALYKEATGDPVGEWLYLWHRYARSYAKLARGLYAVAAEHGVGATAKPEASVPAKPEASVPVDSRIRR